MRTTNIASLPIRIAASLAICAAVFSMAGCTGQDSDQKIQQRAERATRQAKIAADKAAAAARAATANAAREANDVAKGVRAGLHQPGTDKAAGLVDVNSASRAELEHLSGIDRATAKRIQSLRPYRHPRDLVKKGAISQQEYDRIAGNIVARN